MTGNQDFLSSTVVAKSRPQQEIILLGKKISDELLLDRSCETLSKWISHILAEKIVDIKHTKSPQEKSLLEREVVELVLYVWQRRYSLPIPARPFGRVEAAIGYLADTHKKQFSHQEHRDIRDSDYSQLEKLVEAIDLFHSETVPLIALTQIAITAGDNPLEWEEAQREMFESDEVQLIDFLRRWIVELGEHTADDPAELAVSEDRVKKAFEKIDGYFLKVNKSWDDFKIAIQKKMDD